MWRVCRYFMVSVNITVVTMKNTVFWDGMWG